MTFTRYLLFLCGQFGIMALARFVFGWVYKYADAPAPDSDLAIPLFAATTIGLLMLLFRFFDGMIDPIAGSFSDRYKARGKPRQRLLWYALLIAPIGLLLTFAANHGHSPGLRWALLMTGLLTFFIGYTLYCIPYWSLVTDYSEPDPKARPVLSSLLGAGVILATAAGFIISPFLVEHLGYTKAAFYFAVPATLLMLGPIFAAPNAVGESLHPLLPPADPSDHSSTEPILGSLLAALRHRRFLAIIILFAGSQMSLTVMTASAPFLAVNLLGGTESDVAFLLGPLLLVAIPCFLLTPKISRRFGWEKPMVVATIGLGVIYPLTGLLGTPVIGSSTLTAALLFAGGGPFIAILLGLEGEAISACADERSAGLASRYWAAFNFLVKIMNGIAFFCTGFLVAWIPKEVVDASGKTSFSGDSTRFVRLMPVLAGLCLLACLIAYFLIRPRAKKR